MNKMNDVEAHAYLDQCLEQCRMKLALAGPKSRMRMAMQLPIDRDELNAAIMGDGIVGFLEGMSRRNKRIVKNTYAYASISAKILFPSKTQRAARYEAFKNLMFALGWTNYHAALTRYKSSSAKLTMDNVALDIVHSAAGGLAGTAANALKVVADKTIDALKKQPDAVNLFERNTADADGINFGVSVCKQDDDAEVSMVVGTVSCIPSMQHTRVLFVEWNSSDLDIYQGKAYFTIHEEDLRKEAETIKFLDELREALFYEYSPT
ncbi:hypothetical protein D3C84_346210 [compost metagenome]